MKAYGLLIITAVLLIASGPAANAEEKPKPVELRIYDVRAITNPIKDYPAPKVGIPAKIETADEQPAANMSVGDLATIIRDQLMPNEFADPQTSLEENNGQLIVLQHAQAQDRISQMIETLRKVNKSQVAVKGMLVALPQLPTESQISDDELNKLIGNDADAVIACPRLTCYSTQRAHVMSGTQMNVVRRLDLAGDSLDPYVETILDGYALDVKPIVSADRKTVSMVLNFTMNSNVVKTPRTVGLNGAAAAGAALPSSETSSAETTHEGEGKERKQTHTSNAQKKSGLMLGVQYVAGYEYDSVKMDTDSIQTQLVLPAGKWLLAGVLNTVKVPGKTVVLMISADVLN